MKVISWVEYFIKWFLRAMPVPIRITEISLLLLGLIALAVHHYSPNWEVIINPLVWQIPLILLVFVFIGSLAWSSFTLYREKVQIISDLNTQLDAARKMAYPSIVTLMMTPYFKDLDIPLGEFGIGNNMIIDKTFDHCRIHGTIVVHPLNDVTITLCRFKGDHESMFIVTTNKRVQGVLGIQNCTFVNCEFDRVSFIGSQEQIAKLKAGFNIPSH